MSSTYCVIGRLKLVPIEGANKIQLGYYGGLPYVVSKDFNEDELYAIFIPDGQLSKEYFEANKDDLSFFPNNRKVRSIKLMKGTIISVGYVASLESLKYTGIDISTLKEGDSFNDLNGVKVCRKFISKETKAMRAENREKKIAKGVEVGLPMHPDTLQFYRFAETLNVGDVITLTLKLDGTSVRVANAYVQVETPVTEVLDYGGWLNNIRLLRYLKVKRPGNKIMTGTRKVIIERTEGAGYYGNHDMYLELGKRLEGMLYPGESVYAEIVGWIDNERPLFNRGGMVFKYGQPEGTREFYVYNIKWTLPNGMSTDLPWNKVKARCRELGLKHVPEIGLRDNIHYNQGAHTLSIPGGEYNWVVLDNALPQHIFNGNMDWLKDLVYSFVEGPDPIDPSHIREGVVLRIERTNGITEFFKAKSSTFYELESKSKEAGQVDIEEVQDAE